MKDLKINIELKDIDLVKNLIELLQTKFYELPKEIQESIMQIENTGLNDIDADKLREMFGEYDKEDYSTSFHTKDIINVNILLRKVEYVQNTEDGIKKYIERPDFFWIKLKDRIVIEW